MSKHELESMLDEYSRCAWTMGHYHKRIYLKPSERDEVDAASKRHKELYAELVKLASDAAVARWIYDNSYERLTGPYVDITLHYEVPVANSDELMSWANPIKGKAIKTFIEAELRGVEKCSAQ